MYYAGIDLHKKCCQACIIDDGGKVVREEKFEAEVKYILAFFDYAPTPIRIVVEACGIKDNLIDALKQRGFDVLLSDTYKNRLIAEAKVKTDKLDAKILAQLLKANMLAAVWYPPAEIRELIHRLLLRRGIHIPYGKPFSKIGLSFLRGDGYPFDYLVHQLPHTYDQQNATINALDSQINEKASLIKECRLLKTIPGIDYFNAVLIWSEIGCLERFKDYKHLVGMAGLYPRMHTSGETSYAGSIAKGGSPYLRWALVQATHICTRYDNKIARFYHAIEKRRGKKKAIVAAARKMLTIQWHMLKNKEPYIE